MSAGTRAAWIEYANQLRRRLVVVEEDRARLARELNDANQTAGLLRTAVRHFEYQAKRKAVRT